MIIHLYTVAEAAFGVGVFVFCEEPEADVYLRAVKELAGDCDHAVHKVGLDKAAADVAFADCLEHMLPLASTKSAMAWPYTFDAVPSIDS